MAKKQKAKGEAKGKKDNAYQVSWFDKIPYWIKAIIIKWWFFGMIYFFFVMGLAGLIGEDSYVWYIQVVVICFAIGVCTDIFTNNILEVVETRPNQSKWWLMIHGHKFIGFLVNVAYGIVIGLAASFICAWFTSLIDAPNIEAGIADRTYWFREPCSFALVALAVDMLCIGIKDLIVYLINRGKVPEGEGIINGN